MSILNEVDDLGIVHFTDSCSVVLADIFTMLAMATSKEKTSYLRETNIFLTNSVYRMRVKKSVLRSPIDYGMINEIELYQEGVDLDDEKRESLYDYDSGRYGGDRYLFSTGICGIFKQEYYDQITHSPIINSFWLDTIFEKMDLVSKLGKGTDMEYCPYFINDSSFIFTTPSNRLKFPVKIARDKKECVGLKIEINPFIEKKE